jgi:predicted dehydrogenase
MNNVKKQYNIGLAGFGFMGRTHAFAVESLPFFYSSIGAPMPFSARIGGVCTTSPARSAEVAAEFSLGKAYASFEEMVNDPDIDIIDVCTPNIYHYDMVKAALANGKHVYCEKPLCETAERSKEIYELSKSSGLICGMVFNNHHLAAVKRAKTLIDEGRIGKIISFNFEYLHDSCTHDGKAFGWKQNADVCGEGGVLFDLGSHIIDLALMLCGNIVSVTGRSQIAYPSHPDSSGNSWQTNASEAFYMIAKTEGGAMGTLTASKIAKGTGDGLNFEIYGTGGALKFSLMESGRLQFFDASAPASVAGFTTIECGGSYPAPGGFFPSPKAPAGWLRGHIENMYRYLECVNSGTTPSPSFKDGALVSAVMDAALRSDAMGRDCPVIWEDAE